MPTDADHPRGPARPGDGAEPSPLDLGPDRVNELQRVYEQAREAYWSDETGHPGSLEEAHEVGLRAIADALAPPAAPGAAAATHRTPAQIYASGRASGLRSALTLIEACERREDADDAIRNMIATMEDDAPASALPGAEAVAEALTSKQLAERLRERLSHTQGVYLGPSTCANLIAYVLTGLEPGDRRDTGVAAILARLARPDAPEGPVLAGALRADKVRAYLDAADRYIAEVGQWGPGRDRQPVIEARDAALKARADLDGDLRAALDGGAGGGWRHHRTPAQVYRAAKTDGLRAALGLVEGEDTERDAKGMGSPGRRLIRLIGDRLRGRIEAVEREADENQDAPPRSGQRGGDDGAR